jgi:YHS domain-containing protein
MSAVMKRSVMDLVRVLLVMVVLLGGAGTAVGAAETPVTAVNAERGLALKGYDPVAYFTTGRATPGGEAHRFRWQGATYRFASAGNLERFKAEPGKYLPRYGGYCAYAMAYNYIADIDPERWAIVDGGLYLNNGRFAHTFWSLDKPSHIAAADRNWPAYPKKAQEP